MLLGSWCGGAGAGGTPGRSFDHLGAVGRGRLRLAGFARHDVGGLRDVVGGDDVTDKCDVDSSVLRSIYFTLSSNWTLSSARTPSPRLLRSFPEASMPSFPDNLRMM